MEQHQKINHFPGMFNLARKNLMGRYLMKMRKKFPLEYNFFPLTWMLPIEYHELKAYCETKQKGKARTFIVKPEAMSQGKGIYLTRKLDDIEQGSHCVVQRYLHRPYLIQGLKFDLRIYVLVAGVDPLRLYIFNEGLARFATQQYQAPTKQNMQDTCMHLTNYAINKDNPKFVFNNNEKDMTKGHKRSLTWLYQYIKENQPNGQKLQQKIQDLIVKTMISGLPPISNQYRSCQPQNYASNMCFELLGFDVILTEKCEPILLEINHTPSFTTDTPLDSHIKTNFIADSLRLMNINEKTKGQIIKKRKEACHQRVITGKKVKLTPEQRQQRRSNAQSQRDKYENKNLGGFKKIYPVQDQVSSSRYQDLLDCAQDLYLAATGVKNKRLTISAIRNQKTQSAFGTCFSRKNKGDSSNINSAKLKGSHTKQQRLFQRQNMSNNTKQINLDKEFSSSPLTAKFSSNNIVYDKMITSMTAQTGKKQQIKTEVQKNKQQFDEEQKLQQSSNRQAYNLQSQGSLSSFNMNKITKSQNNIFKIDGKQTISHKKHLQAQNSSFKGIFEGDESVKQSLEQIKQNMDTQIKTAKILAYTNIEDQQRLQYQHCKTRNNCTTINYPIYHSNKNIPISSATLNLNNYNNTKSTNAYNSIVEKRINGKSSVNVKKILSNQNTRNPKNIQILFEQKQPNISNNPYQITSSNIQKKQQKNQTSQNRGVSLGYFGSNSNSINNRGINQCGINSSTRKANPASSNGSVTKPKSGNHGMKIPITLNTLLINGYDAQVAQNLRKILSMNDETVSASNQVWKNR